MARFDDFADLLSSPSACLKGEWHAGTMKWLLGAFRRLRCGDDLRNITSIQKKHTMRPSSPLSYLLPLFFITFSIPAFASEKPQGDFPYGPGLALGGAGGVYFLADPGELVVDVFKRDHRNNRNTELRAILVGPDRQVVAETTIPSDAQTGEKGPASGRVLRLKTTVPRKGVYGLNITVGTDRYGQRITWGFRTNCPKFWIETSRGHKDERHQEPIILLSPNTSGDVCFNPRPGKIAIEVTGLPKGVKALSVFSADQKTLATIPVDDKGVASHTFGAEVSRGSTPWRLHLPKCKATINIDGLTRWDKTDPYDHFSLWTCTPDAAFPFHEYRWLLQPYRETVYWSGDDVSSGDKQGEHTFFVQNNGTKPATIQLELEFPDKPWPATLSDASVTLLPKKSKSVTVRYSAPPKDATQTIHLRATPKERPDFSTYSKLTITSRPPPKSGVTKKPILLKPYVWEGEAYGNRPAYPTGSQFYFDLENRPFVYSGSTLKMRGDTGWENRDLKKAVTSWTLPDAKASHIKWSFHSPTGKVAFDQDNDVYLLSTSGAQAAVLHSHDDGKTFQGYLLPNKGRKRSSFDIEQFSGHNTPEGPPPLVRVTQLAKDPKLIWRRLCRLELFVPTKDATGKISIGEPILLSEKCLGISAHSGIPSSIVSRDGKVHVVWAEATDPKEKVPGTPTYAATYDIKTKTLSNPVCVAYGPPANDVHNTPSISIDSVGTLHVLGGTHGRPFPYAHSLKPNDTTSGWSEPVLSGPKLSQTYIGLVCLPDDSLYTVFRLWGNYEAPFPLSHHARLASQHKPIDATWQSPHKVLVSAFSEYSVFYHRLTIDRRGRLFLSYQYWSTHWFYRNDRFHDGRSVLMSPDGGKSWRFAKDEDFR